MHEAHSAIAAPNVPSLRCHNKGTTADSEAVLFAAQFPWDFVSYCRRVLPSVCKVAVCVSMLPSLCAGGAVYYGHHSGGGVRSSRRVRTVRSSDRVFGRSILTVQAADHDDRRQHDVPRFPGVTEGTCSPHRCIMHSPAITTEYCALYDRQKRVLEYYNHQWEKHRLLVGENSLGFMKTLSEPLQNEIFVFMVRVLSPTMHWCYTDYERRIRIACWM